MNVPARAATAATPAVFMKAWVCPAYGGPEVLVLEDRPVPVPKDGEVLVRIHATTVSSADARVRGLDLPRGFGPFGRLIFGLSRPRQPVLGTELSGTVEAVGRRVTRWKPGDEVIAFPGSSLGCHAQFRAVRAEERIARKPENLSFEEASTLCFGGTTAMHFLRQARLRPGERVLVIGASGAVGSAMVQLARLQGAHVTGVTSTRNIGLVRSLGADAVIDYTKKDFTAAGQSWDIVADTVGASSFTRCLPVLNRHGRYLAVAGDLIALITPRRLTKRSIAGPAVERTQDVIELAALAQAGLIKPVIDTVYGFAQMPQAHARVDTGRKRGSVVVSVTGEGDGMRGHALSAAAPRDRRRRKAEKSP